MEKNGNKLGLSCAKLSPSQSNSISIDWTEICYIITVRPTPPTRASILNDPRGLKFCLRPHLTTLTTTQHNLTLLFSGGGGSSTHPPPTRVNPRGLKFCLPPHLTTTQHNLTLLFSGGGGHQPIPPYQG